MNSTTGASGQEGFRFSLPDLASARFLAPALAAITVFSFFYQQRWGSITDTSWLITVCERVLAGENLYVDIFETNPPFSVWLYMPPVALAGFLGVAPEILVHAWTYLAAMVGLGFAGVIVRRARFPEETALLALSPVFYALLVIMPGNAFSQREHIAMALFLPLLALTACRARGKASDPSVGMAVLAGLCGSVLVLVKPYYALMVLPPDGRLSHYFFGIEYAPRDLRLALIDAGERRIGSAVDQLLLACFHYDPKSGKYSLAIMKLIRMAGIVTLAAIGGVIVLLRRRERRGPRPDRERA